MWVIKDNNTGKVIGRQRGLVDIDDDQVLTYVRRREATMQIGYMTKRWNAQRYQQMDLVPAEARAHFI